MGGKSNRNFKVEDKEGIWFVRIPWEIDVADREIEGQNILALRDCNKLANVLPTFYLYLLQGRNILSPESVEEVNLPDGTMITSYINGKELDAELLEKEEVQKALVSTLHTFHASGVRFVNAYDPFRNEISSYKNKATKNPVDQLVAARELIRVEEAEKIAEKILPQEAAVSTHNDLNFGNLLLAGERLYLTDFEYSGFNLRGGIYYDFGTLLGENLFHQKPLKLEIFEKVLERASVVYGREIFSSRAYCGAMVNVLVCFWWGLVEYFHAATEARREFFKNFVAKRIQGIGFLRKFLGGDKRIINAPLM